MSKYTVFDVSTLSKWGSQWSRVHSSNWKARSLFSNGKAGGIMTGGLRWMIASPALKANGRARVFTFVGHFDDKRWVWWNLFLAAAGFRTSPFRRSFDIAFCNFPVIFLTQMGRRPLIFKKVRSFGPNDPSFSHAHQVSTLGVCVSFSPLNCKSGVCVCT